VDSSSDIPEALAKENDITVVPLTITFGNEQYRDYYDLTPRTFYEKLRSHGEPPKSSQPNPHTFMEYFRGCEGEYEDILCITLSSNGSGTFDSASMAQKEYNGNPANKTRVHLFDTLNASLGVTLLAMKAADMIRDRLPIPQILEKLAYYRARTGTYIITETLEYLKKGGRVNTVTAILGGLLDIRPIITVLGGWGRTCGKVRGEKQVNRKLLEIFSEKFSELEVYVSYADCVEHARELADMLRKGFEGIKIVLAEMGATMGTHAGPGSVGIHFIEKTPLPV
jgi:DegV family protein with EDD domain